MSDLFGYGDNGPDLFTLDAVDDVPDRVPDDVASLFQKLALHLFDTGWRRYSSDAILHRIRWHFRVERNQREFKCNDHWTAPLSRWCMKRHPKLTGFFETRGRNSIANVNGEIF